MLSALYAIARPSVRLSVRLSVTRVDQSKTVEARIMQFSPYSSSIPLVFAGYVSSRNSNGIPPSGGVKQGWVCSVMRALLIRDVFIRYSLDGAVIVRHGVFL